MTHFRVHGSLHSHPKALAAEPAALGLWALAGSWCANSGTDGFVPTHVAAWLTRGGARLAARLVECGLWEQVEDGYQFHDWRAYNRPAESVRADRDAARGRMARLRAERTSTSAESPLARAAQ